MGYKNNDQFQLARDMFRWQRFMNMAMNRRVPTRPSISSPAEEWRYTLKNHPLSWISWLCNLFVPQGRHDGKPCHFTRCMMLAVQHIATTFGFRHAVNIVWCKWRRYIMTEYTFICSHKNWQSCEETLFASITCIMEINSFHLKLFVSLVHSLLSLRMALLTHGATGELVEDLALACMFHSFISIQPYRPGWQEPEPSHVTGMALAHCILGKYLGVVCHCFPPPLVVPTFASKCLYVRNDARDPSSERWNYLGEKHSR